MGPHGFDLTSTSNTSSMRLRDGKFEGQVNTLNSLSCSSNFPEEIQQWQGAYIHLQVATASTVALKGCPWSSVASTCPSYIYMSSRSQVFTGEHHIATEGFALFPLCTLLRFLPQVSGDAEVYSLFVVSILIVNANAPFILEDEKIVDSSLLEAHWTALTCWIVDMY